MVALFDPSTQTVKARTLRTFSTFALNGGPRPLSRELEPFRQQNNSTHSGLSNVHNYSFSIYGLLSCSGKCENRCRTSRCIPFHVLADIF